MLPGIRKLDFVHKIVYYLSIGDEVKKRDLEKKLTELGWYLKTHGGRHDIWTNGQVFEPVPRHTEIKEILAKKIIKKAINNPPRET